jgi:hypothetical protein
MIMAIAFAAACLVVYSLVWSIRTSGSRDDAASAHGAHGAHGGHH